MSGKPTDSVAEMPIAVLGDGCAGLSLAAYADRLPHYKLEILTSSVATPQANHIWGFWQMGWLQDAVPLARKTWHKWSVRTAKNEVVMQADVHPYHALMRHCWLAHCRRRAAQHGVRVHNDASIIAGLPNHQVFDSRPPKRRSGMMLQHFIGWEVQAAAGSFDDSSAVLMDFRCEQSRGMHFIYCLPFSDREALVESTLFSPHLEMDSFYETAISEWLRDCSGISDYQIVRRERGVIPLGLMARHDPDLPGIGGNCGAIRPSSGYAFSFIQKQIANALAGVASGRTLRFTSPHRAIDLWMDRIFLSVLRHQPQHAPELFAAIAGRLSGDEFACFLSGEATMALRAKVVTAMPLLPFLRALLCLEPGAP